ncbi:YciI family protein [Thermoactinospora rubra]|uniref:YciI family protein n=1 Tax=Thermoactinospora rubra TaxID=1088767 RepID=UPI000A122093|nr:YciI family protein [Thermoactinospora rubra]
MDRYLLSIIQPDGDPPPDEQLREVMDRVGAWERQAKSAGVWVFAAGLHPAEQATVLRPATGQAKGKIIREEVLATDGPYAEGKEHIGGFTVIQAPDRQAALAWAADLARAVTLPIEVRQIHT